MWKVASLFGLLCSLSVCVALVAPSWDQSVVARHGINTNPLSPITSIEEMDAANLRGMKYNDTQPPVTNPQEFRGKRIAIVASHCFEDLQLYFPLIYFKNRGAEVSVVAPDWVGNRVAACEFVVPSAFSKVDLKVSSALNTVLFDAVIVPGVIWSSTVMRNDAQIVELLNKHKYKSVLGFICTGAALSIETNLASSLNSLTGSAAIKTDLLNAGAVYKDVPVVKHAKEKIVFGRDSSGTGTLQFTEAVAEVILLN
jgi:protease I